MAKWVVLAGNYREYQQWCRRNVIHPRDALFVAESSNLGGRGRDLSTATWIRTGTFLDRRDVDEVMAMAKVMQAPPLTIDSYPD